MQDSADARNSGIEQRTTALIETIEKFKRTSGNPGSRIALGRLPVEGCFGGNPVDGDLGASSDQQPGAEEVGVGSDPAGMATDSGKLPISDSSDFERHPTSLATRPSVSRRHGGASRLLIRGSETCTFSNSVDSLKGKRVGSSYSPHRKLVGSGGHQVGCGSSSSMNPTNFGEEVEGNDHENIAGKELFLGLTENASKIGLDRPDSAILRRCVETDGGRRSSEREAESCHRRRSRPGKQIEVVESDDESLFPETSLSLGSHPRYATADSGSSRVASSNSAFGASWHAEPGEVPVHEANLVEIGRSKRKRDVGQVDRTESAAAVGIALESVDKLAELPDTLACSSKRIRLPRGHQMGSQDGIGDLQSSRALEENEDWRSVRIPGQSMRRGSHARMNPIIRRSVIGVPSATQATTDPCDIETLQLLSGPRADTREEDERDQSREWRLPRQSLLTTNPMSESSMNVIDLDSPERPSWTRESSRNSLGQDDSLSGRHHGSSFRRLPRGLSERPRHPTARRSPNQRPANEAGSSQDISQAIGIQDFESYHIDSSRRRTQHSQPYFLRSGPRGSWDDEDIRELDPAETAVYNRSNGGTFPRMGRHLLHSGAGPLSMNRNGLSQDNGSRGDGIGLALSSTVRGEESVFPLDMAISVDSDEEDFEKSRQLAEDERLARELQAAYMSEAIGGDAPDDESFARMLQAEEDTRAREFRHAHSNLLGFSSAVQRYLGDMQDPARETRLMRHSRVRSDSLSHSSSSSRVGPIHGSGARTGGFRLFRGQQPPPQENGGELPGGRVQFPPSMAMETRLEVLATLELAFQEPLPVGLQLAQVDRDFNENDYEMLLALDTDVDRNKGASLEKIALLPVSTIQPTDVCDETCSICLELHVAGEVVRRLPCIHVFHQAVSIPLVLPYLSYKHLTFGCIGLLCKANAPLPQEFSLGWDS